MDEGTVTAPAELSMDALDRKLAGMRSEAAPKLAFKQNQIPTKISMFDEDVTGFAIVCQTENGWLTRIVLNKRQALRLSIALNTYVAGQL